MNKKPSAVCGAEAQAWFLPSIRSKAIPDSSRMFFRHRHRNCRHARISSTMPVLPATVVALHFHAIPASPKCCSHFTLHRWSPCLLMVYVCSGVSATKDGLYL
uniref:Uncharacterized protein n=1 Tax=Mus musculus TaxID=10090 RepID=Q3UE70_MOUSE|nr:unnamed protein product [Mus musculus]BAE29041.1 unnamed protein product [Mus musculus]BAE29215.1 unnamed protein product [Mus musculus]